MLKFRIMLESMAFIMDQNGFCGIFREEDEWITGRSGGQ